MLISFMITLSPYDLRQAMFESIDKSWDERAVKGQSLRRMFVWLLSWALILGAGMAMMLHAFVHSHRFDWSVLSLSQGQG